MKIKRYSRYAAAVLFASTSLGGPALLAQTAGNAAADSDIVVTGSRIVRDGFEAPTPTTVFGVEELQRNVPINIANQVNELPSLAGSTRNVTNNVSGGTIGVNSLSLRNMGASRTLVLMDGQRLPVATMAATIDVNVIPNALVQRIDIVTGGASAAWGSDAVAGVVNFVLDKDFSGIKGDVHGGISTYGDLPSFGMSFAAGSRFADNRAHVMVSAEYSWEGGMQGLKNRDWYIGTKRLFNPNYTPTNGEPELIVRDHVGYSTLAPGGIVVSGPLRGVYFGEGGTPLQFHYGDITRDPYTVGGDWQATDMSLDGESFVPAMRRLNLFGRLSYEVTDNLNVYAQVSYNRAHANSIGSSEYRTRGLIVKRDNPFLPASVAAAMDDNGLDQIELGTWAKDLVDVRFTSTRELKRYTVGASGDFTAAGSDWKWDAFYNRNISDIMQDAWLSNNSRYNEAIDAVMGPNGTPICRSSLADPTNGCVPLNVMGVGVASQGAIDYVKGHSHVNEQFTMDEAALTLNGEPFSTWAGPVPIAFGIEYRREKASGTNDPVSAVNGFVFGNYKPIFGSYNVKEAFLEVSAPLARDQAFARSLELNAAIRGTDYSTSGGVLSWKLGAIWQPIDDIKFRVTRSRDIRAGNMANLFQTGRTTTITIDDPEQGNVSYIALTNEIGNPVVKPEIARTWNFGGVLTPTFLPGFTLSVDYFDIALKGAIGSLGAQALLNLCHDGRDPTICAFAVRDPANGDRITRIDLKPINLAIQEARGIDFEASYRFSLDQIADALGSGNISIRALATHYLEAYTDQGLPGSIRQFSLGDVSGTPHWRYRVEGLYSNDHLSAGLTARGVSSGVLNPQYIECTTGCPTSTAQHQTIDNNHVDGALYFDVSFSYKFEGGIEAFAAIQNIANKDPAQSASSTSIPGAQWGISRAYYDDMGRMFRGGVRFKF